MRSGRGQKVFKEFPRKPTPGIGFLKEGEVILTATKRNPKLLLDLKQGPGCPPVTVLWPSDTPVVYDEESIDLTEKRDVGVATDKDVSAFTGHHVEET
jgi:hypothetical protein